MKAYCQQLTQALLELACAVTNHADGCRVLNRGWTQRLYAWSMGPVLDVLEAEDADDDDDDDDGFPAALPEGVGVACLACRRAFHGELITCPRLNCPVVGLPQC